MLKQTITFRVYEQPAKFARVARYLVYTPCNISRGKNNICIINATRDAVAHGK